MKITVSSTPFHDLLIIEPKVFSDERGFFMESWNKSDFEEAGITAQFVQDNHSRSQKNVLRGLHYQTIGMPLAKLVRCTVGEIYDVTVDLRVSSATYGKWFGIHLNAENKKELFVPVGFAHGFAVISDVAEVHYKQTNYFSPDHERILLWNDPDIAISWPIPTPLLSEKDLDGKSFAEYQKNPAFS